MYYSVTLNGITVSRVELDAALDPAELTAQLQTENLTTEDGDYFRATSAAVLDASVTTSFRRSQLFSGLVLAKRVASSNVANVEKAVAHSYLLTMRGW